MKSNKYIKSINVIDNTICTALITCKFPYWMITEIRSNPS